MSCFFILCLFTCLVQSAPCNTHPPDHLAFCPRRHSLGHDAPVVNHEAVEYSSPSSKRSVHSSCSQILDSPIYIRFEDEGFNVTIALGLEDLSFNELLSADTTLAGYMRQFNGMNDSQQVAFIESFPNKESAEINKTLARIRTDGGDATATQSEQAPAALLARSERNRNFTGVIEPTRPCFCDTGFGCGPALSGVLLGGFVTKFGLDIMLYSHPQWLLQPDYLVNTLRTASLIFDYSMVIVFLLGFVQVFKSSLPAGYKMSHALFQAVYNILVELKRSIVERYKHRHQNVNSFPSIGRCSYKGIRATLRDFHEDRYRNIHRESFYTAKDDPLPTIAEEDHANSPFLSKVDELNHQDGTGQNPSNTLNSIEVVNPNKWTGPDFNKPLDNTEESSPRVRWKTPNLKIEEYRGLKEIQMGQTHRSWGLDTVAFNSTDTHYRDLEAGEGTSRDYSGGPLASQNGESSHLDPKFAMNDTIYTGLYRLQRALDPSARVLSDCGDDRLESSLGNGIFVSMPMSKAEAPQQQEFPGQSRGTARANKTSKVLPAG